MDVENQNDRTLYVGNLEPRVTDELLFELFLQAGPVKHVSIPKDREGKQKNFAFVEFKHDVSVPYALQLMGGLALFGRSLRLQFRSGSKHQAQGNIAVPPIGLPNPALGPTSPMGPPGAFAGMGARDMMPPPIHRSASAPDALFKLGQDFQGGAPQSLMGAGPSNQRLQQMPMMMPTSLGLPPGTPFSQGAAFSGYSQGNQSPVPQHQLHSNRGGSPYNSYDSPHRRSNDDDYLDRPEGSSRLGSASQSNRDIDSHYETPSGRGRERDRDVDMERRGRNSSYDSDSSRYQGHDRGQYDDRGRYGGHRGRERRSEHERHSRVNDSYRDRSGSRDNYDRRGYDDSRHQHRHYHR